MGRKIFFETAPPPPLSQGLHDRPPLSEGLGQKKKLRFSFIPYCLPKIT